jgi:hypothetical protein
MREVPMAEQSPRLTAKILWGALLFGPTMFLAIALYLVVGLRGGAGLGSPLDAAAMIGASALVSATTVAVSWGWAVRMRRPAKSGLRLRGGGAIPPGPEADAITRLVVACALCEFGALVAVIVFMLTGSGLALAPYALSWLALAAHFPGDRHWARLAGGPQPGAPGPNRMIRG